MEFKLFDSVDEMKRLLQNNQPRRVMAGNSALCIVRQEDKLVAFRNECPHMGDGLDGGLINYLNEIVCPLHTYKFNLKTGQEERQRCSGLRFVEVRIFESGVFLSLGDAE